MSIGLANNNYILQLIFQGKSASEITPPHVVTCPGFIKLIFIIIVQATFTQFSPLLDNKGASSLPWLFLRHPPGYSIHAFSMQVDRRVTE